MQKIVAAHGAIETVTPLSIVTWKAEAVRHAEAVGGDRVVCIVGDAQGGAPGEPYVFRNAAEAAKVLVSGELLDAIHYAFAAAAETPRAVVAVNVRGGTPAAYSVKDKDNKTVFSLETLTYREPANQTTFSLTGTAETGFNLQIKDSVGGGAVGYSKLGIGLYLQYVGGGKAATAEVVEIEGAKHLKTTVTGGEAGESLLIPLTGLTIREVAERIMRGGPYNAMTARTANLPAEGLDKTESAVDILGANVVGVNSAKVEAGTDSISVTANLKRDLAAGETLKFYADGGWKFLTVKDKSDKGQKTVSINSVNFAVPADAAIMDSSIKPPVALTAINADFRDFLTTRGGVLIKYIDGDPEAGIPVVQAGNFSGGGSRHADISDWEQGVENALEEDFGSMVALTNDQGIVFGVRARLQAARNPREGKFVQLFSGVDQNLLPQNENPAELRAFLQNVTSLIATINDRDSVVVTQSVEVVNPRTGRLERVPPYFTAVFLAALAAGTGRENSLTYGYLSASNPLPNLKSLKDEFTLAGTTVLVPPKKSVSARVELGRTAYVGEDNTIYESEKSVRLMNSIARDLRALQENMIPGKATAEALGRYKRELNNYFESLKQRQLIRDGYDQEGNLAPAYEFEVSRTSYQGRKVSTKARVNPTGEFVVAELELLARPVEIEV